MVNVSTSDRNQEIYRLKLEGWTCHDLGRKSGLSRGRVHAIYKKHADSLHEHKLMAAFRRRVVQDNDPDKQYDFRSLVDLLVPQARQKRRIYARGLPSKGSNLSVRQFFDMIVCHESGTRSCEQPYRLMSITGVGLKTFRQTIAHISKLDLGKAANEEWGRRVGLLREHQPAVAKPVKSS